MLRHVEGTLLASAVEARSLPVFFDMMCCLYRCRFSLALRMVTDDGMCRDIDLDISLVDGHFISITEYCCDLFEW